MAYAKRPKAAPQRPLRDIKPGGLESCVNCFYYADHTGRGECIKDGRRQLLPARPCNDFR